MAPLKFEDPLNPSLTSLEKAVLEKIFEEEKPLQIVLKEQLKNATITSREFSGVGFFTSFKVPESVPPVPSSDWKNDLGSVGAEIKGLEHGAGFVLFLTKEGYLSTLEGYSYDEPWPEDTSSFKLK